MAFRLELAETVPAGIQRITREQLQRAADHLRIDRGSAEEQVHEARKCLKRLRAVVRLVKPQIGVDVYARENTCFRDAAKSLAGQRDATALIETLDELLKWLGTRAPRSHFAAVRQWLVGRRDLAYAQTGSFASVADSVIVELAQAERRVPSWPLEGGGWAAVESGLRSVYTRGRREFDCVSQNPTDEAFHIWRKRVKYLWYCEQILMPIWPAQMGPAADQLDELGAALGRDHDLAMLSDTVEAEYPRTGATATLAALRRRIAERRTGLQAKIELGALRIYAEQPRAFTRRLRGYWRAWSEEQRRHAKPRTIPAAVAPGAPGLVAPR